MRRQDLAKPDRRICGRSRGGRGYDIMIDCGIGDPAAGAPAARQDRGNVASGSLGGNRKCERGRPGPLIPAAGTRAAREQFESPKSGLALKQFSWTGPGGRE